MSVRLYDIRRGLIISGAFIRGKQKYTRVLVQVFGAGVSADVSADVSAGVGARG
jgi:hypothetical protein